MTDALETEPDFDTALLANLTVEEDRRLQPYDDATGKTLRPGDTLRGKLTVGIGRNLTDRGLTKDETDYLARNDIALVKAGLDRAFPWWRTLPMPARLAVADMGFNMGVAGLSHFVDMWGALKDHDFQRAADEAMDSAFAREVPRRAAIIKKLFLAAGQPRT